MSQALADSLEGREPLFPKIAATPEAFFRRGRDLRPACFAEVFERFTLRIVDAVPPRYAADLAPVYARFAAVVLLDGSRLAAIARRLKLLWHERAVIPPGALLGVYDLGRGVCRGLHFDPDAAASEVARAVVGIVGRVPIWSLYASSIGATSDAGGASGPLAATGNRSVTYEAGPGSWRS